MSRLDADLDPPAVATPSISELLRRAFHTEERTLATIDFRALHLSGTTTPVCEVIKP
jgi:hypothetical protein